MHANWIARPGNGRVLGCGKNCFPGLIYLFSGLGLFSLRPCLSYGFGDVTLLFVSNLRTSCTLVQTQTREAFTLGPPDGRFAMSHHPVAVGDGWGDGVDMQTS